MIRTVESNIAGLVWKVERRPGETVEVDDVLVILESMKMEIPVVATHSGRLQSIDVAEGDSVAEGQTIATIAT